MKWEPLAHDHQPRVVVFDVIETLFSLEPTRAAMTKVGMPPEALEAWFARLLRDAFAITAAGGYAAVSRRSPRGP